MTSAYETLHLEVDPDGVALLTLSRPEAMNSFTVTMARELEAFFLAAADDDEEPQVHMVMAALSHYQTPAIQAALDRTEL